MEGMSLYVINWEISDQLSHDAEKHVHCCCYKPSHNHGEDPTIPILYLQLHPGSVVDVHVLLVQWGGSQRSLLLVLLPVEVRQAIFCSSNRSIGAT